MFRLARRLAGLALLGAVVYLAVTFVQVVQASRRDQRPRADAIVVFGAAQYNGRPSPVLRARLDHAAKLYGEHLAPTIVVTGGRPPGDPTGPTEATASADYLTGRRGIRQSAILRETRGRTSWESLASAANELRKRGKERVILVSDPFHAARIAAMADELGFEASVSPTRTSPIRGATELRYLGRETAAVAAGRIVGFHRLVGIDRAVLKVRESGTNG